MTSNSIPQSNDGNAFARRPRRNVPRNFGKDAVIARARELLADPAYPTPEIVEDLADMLARYGVLPSKGEPDA